VEEITAFFSRINLIAKLLVQHGNLKELVEHVLKKNINLKELYNGNLTDGNDDLWRIRLFARRLEAT